jgi:integrase
MNTTNAEATHGAQRGVRWRAHPRGSQRLPGGARGDWWVSIVCADGHRHRLKIGAKSAAREEHGRLRARIRREGWCPDRERRAKPLGLDAVLGLVVTDYALNGKRSTARIEQAKARLTAYFGVSTSAAAITPVEITKYTEARLETGAAPATVNRELACLRRGFRLARRAGRVPDVPPISLLAERNVRQGFFEAPEYCAVRDALPAELRPLVTFLYLTGWRLGEVLPLTWRQVDFRAGVVRLEPGTTKNREGRVFPFAVLPELAALLQAQREHTTALERTTGRIVPAVFHRDGAPIRDLRGAWETACIAAGFFRVLNPEAPLARQRKKATKLLHDFRRTAVRNLERAGVPRSVAMKLTGHKTEAVYRRYAIVSEGDLADGVAKLAALHQALGAAPRAVIPLQKEVAPVVAPRPGRRQVMRRAAGQ